MRRFEIFTDWFDIENGTTVDPEFFLRMGGGGVQQLFEFAGVGVPRHIFYPLQIRAWYKNKECLCNL